jgi:sterol desaturase/sphingolipid hydroxylase (fatty acid hydroxylase superfamily)
MTTQEFLGNVGIIAVLMAATALVELAVPLFARGERSRGRAGANFGLSALTLALNWGMTSLAAVVALRIGTDGRGLLAYAGLPLPALVAVSVVTLDLCTYAAHRSMHALPFLWRAHRVHHSDPFLDVTSTLRQHPLEGLWRFAWIVFPAWLLGLPAAAVVAYRLLSVLQGILEHANVRVFAPLDRIVSLVWVTPNMHKVHHSRRPEETDSNYGNLLALFDRALRSFTPSDRAFAVSYGLDDVEPARAKSLAGLLALPFDRLREVAWRDGARARGTATLGRSE